MSNSNSKGQFIKGIKHTPEWKKMMSDRMKKIGNKPPPAFGNHNMSGKHHSKETKIKMSLKGKGRKLSLETRLKQSKSFKKYYKEHPGIRAGKNHPQWIDGRSKDKENKKQYKKENRSRYNYLEARRRVKKLGNGGSHTFGEWENLKLQYNLTCPSCKKSEPEILLTQDHIIPISKGGSDIIENIQPLCKNCNCRKHTTIIKYI